MSSIEISQILYDSEVATALRESIYAFPLVEGFHLIGLAFSVGLLFFVDLRLLGIFLPKTPVENILNPLRPWILGGFLISFITGILLFIAGAIKISTLDVFYYKLAFIGLAGVNAIIFEIKWGKLLQNWGVSELPTKVKLAGSISLVLWSLVIITGRLIPYLSYE